MQSRGLCLCESLSLILFLHGCCDQTVSWSPCVHLFRCAHICFCSTRPRLPNLALVSLLLLSESVANSLSKQAVPPFNIPACYMLAIRFTVLSAWYTIHLGVSLCILSGLTMTTIAQIVGLFRLYCSIIAIALTPFLVRTSTFMSIMITVAYFLSLSLGLLVVTIDHGSKSIICRSRTSWFNFLLSARRNSLHFAFTRIFVPWDISARTYEIHHNRCHPIFDCSVECSA